MMRKKEKIAFILAVLEEHFPHPEIPLHHKDLFTLLIAVLLSARCTDAQVNKITPALFAKASTPEAMRRLGKTEIQKIIRPCGLSPQKSRAIYELSGILLDKFEGKVPSSLEELESLPGVGHKTASIVIAEGFGVPSFPVDTHIHRLAKRWGLSTGKSVVQTERDLMKAFPKETWQKVHLQMIYYGRKFCPARGHVVENCPICSSL